LAKLSKPLPDSSFLGSSVIGSTYQGGGAVAA
jgi:hypothetical protein